MVFLVCNIFFRKYCNNEENSVEEGEAVAGVGSVEELQGIHKRMLILEKFVSINIKQRILVKKKKRKVFPKINK